MHKDGVNGVEGIRDATSVTVSPDNKNVYVTGNFGLAVFNRDTATGALTFAFDFNSGSGGIAGISGARSAIVSPDNKNLYLCSMMENTLVGFNRDTTTGALAFLFTIRGASGTPASIAISPDNNEIYGGGFFKSVLSVFHRNTGTGRIIDTAHYEASGCILEGTPRVAISPDNKNVYVVNSSGESIAIFNRDPDTGYLTGDDCVNFEGDSGVRNCQIVVSPDNKNLYLASANAIAVFKKDVLTGDLTFSASIPVSIFHFTNSSVAVSPDNMNVYAACGSL